MPFTTSTLPVWNNTGAAPTTTKQTEGWKATEHPPASIFNWFFNRTFKALEELQQNAIHKDQKGVNNGVASLDATGDVPIGQADNILNWVKGFGIGDVAKVVTGDINVLDATGVYQGTGLTNAPNSSSSNFLIFNMKYSSTNKAQLAFRVLSNEFYYRTMGNGVWSGWSALETTMGAQTKADGARDEAIQWAKDRGLANAVAISSGTNFNNLIDAGLYALTSGIAVNAPIGGAGFIEVLNSANNALPVQRFHLIYSNRMWIRSRSGPNIDSVWNPWNEVTTDAAQTWLIGTLQNGWVSGYGGDAVRYAKNGNILHIDGTVTGGTVGQPIFTLPAGYRPTEQKIFLGPTLGANSTTSSFNRVVVEPDGRVMVALTNTAYAVVIDCVVPLF